MIYLRSLLFWLGMAFSTLVWAPVCVFAVALPFPKRFRVVSQWSRFNLWWLAKTCRLTCTVEGKENIPAETNGVVLCKHQSAWETLALQRIFPPLAWVLKRELLWIPFFGWGLAVLEPIAIDRKASRRALRQLLDQGTARLDAGRWVVVFPEGTRVRPGERRPYHIGGALLAAKAGLPVVPVAHNAGEFWPRRSFLKHPGTIRLCIGPAIETRGRKPQEINAEAEAWIEATCAALAGGAADEAQAPPSGAGG